MKNRYKVNVYEEYVLTYFVEAENSKEAKEIAEGLSDGDENMEFFGSDIEVKELS